MFHFLGSIALRLLGLSSSPKGNSTPKFRARVGIETLEDRFVPSGVFDATQTDALVIDQENDGDASPGDTIQYTAVLENSGTLDAEGIQFSAILDPHTELVPDSIEVTPIAFDDFYFLEHAAEFNASADAGMLVNDVDPDHSQFPATNADLLVDTQSVQRVGGSVTGQLAVLEDGSISYIAPENDKGFEVFQYDIIDEQGLYNVKPGYVAFLIDSHPADQDHPHCGPPGQTGDHPLGGPPGQTGDHPHGGPPGQTGDHPHGGPPGQTGDHPLGGPPGQDDNDDVDCWDDFRQQIGQLIGEGSLADEGNDDPPAAAADGDLVSISEVGLLPTGKAVQISYQAIVDDPLPSGVDDVTAQGVFTNESGLTRFTDDPTVDGASDANVTAVTAAPDLFLTYDSVPGESDPGETVVVELGYGNQGNQDATVGSILQTVPVHATFSPGQSSIGWTQIDNQTLSFDIGELAAGQSGSLKFALTLNNDVPTDVSELALDAQIQDDGINGLDAFPSDNAASTTILVDHTSTDVGQTNNDDGNSDDGNSDDDATQDETGGTQDSPTVTNSVLPPVSPLLVAGADAGGGPHVRAFDPNSGAELFNFFAYDAAFTGGVRVAAGDVNGDNFADIITGAGSGGGPHVKVFDGVTGAEIRSFFAFDPAFSGGVFVAAGDVNGDHIADIVVGADAGGGPHVRVFSGADHSLLMDFFAYDAMFTGGVRVAAGDVNGDNFADIITGAGPGGGPHVRAFSGDGMAELRSFFAYDPAYTGGVYVAAGDVDGDGVVDILTGAHTQAPALAFDGQSGALVRSYVFTNLESSLPSEVRVAVTNQDASTPSRIAATQGDGAPMIETIDGESNSTLDGFFAFDPNFTNGVFVGGS